ncbi:MAG: hypothetical protein KAG56_07350 [Sulfurovaceae bacterium]|nr:hypothetical protein [Sulfurovaceae bacterium]
MLNLEFELIAILILVAVIGVLMGRFLCKSGESEEREKKKKVIHAFKSSENELDLSRESSRKHLLRLKQQEEKIAKQEQEISNSKTKVDSSDTQRIELLDELKVLEKYKSRFESLEREFKLQNKISDGLKEEKIANQKEIADFKILIDELNKNILHLKKNQSEVEKEHTLNKRLLTDKEREHDKLLTDVHQEHQLKLKDKDALHESLEKNKNQDYNELKKELESVEREYEAFKLNHSLDNERLQKLEIDNEKIYHTLESIALEKEDLVARLRAISSVVGAVGIDRAENTQSLLENR